MTLAGVPGGHSENGALGTLSKGGFENVFCSKVTLSAQSRVPCRPVSLGPPGLWEVGPVSSPSGTDGQAEGGRGEERGLRPPQRSRGLSSCLGPDAHGHSSVTTRTALEHTHAHACLRPPQSPRPHVPKGRALVFLVQCRGCGGTRSPMCTEPCSVQALPLPHGEGGGSLSREGALTWGPPWTRACPAAAHHTSACFRGPAVTRAPVKLAR